MARAERHVDWEQVYENVDLSEAAIKARALRLILDDLKQTNARISALRETIRQKSMDYQKMREEFQAVGITPRIRAIHSELEALNKELEALSRDQSYFLQQRKNL